MLSRVEMRRCYCLLVFGIFSFFVISSSGQSLADISAGSLDTVIRDQALRELLRRHTGVLYDVPLPAEFSGIEASVARMRTRGFWAGGANFSTFRIPPKTTPQPHVKRIAIVYQNLGTWSSSYYSLPGYTMVSPVLGLLVYDASGGNNTNQSSNGTQELDLNVVTGEAIYVNFSKFALPLGMNSSAKCVAFGRNGSVVIDGEAPFSHACLTKSPGHFAIVVPSAVAAHPSGGARGGNHVVEKRRKEMQWQWRVWVVAVSGCIVVGSVFVCLLGLGIFRFVRNMRFEKMVKKAEEGEALGSVWIGGSKMPTAGMTRTKPVLESESSL